MFKCIKFVYTLYICFRVISCEFLWEEDDIERTQIIVIKDGCNIPNFNLNMTYYDVEEFVKCVNSSKWLPTRKTDEVYVEMCNLHFITIESPRVGLEAKYELDKSLCLVQGVISSLVMAGYILDGPIRVINALTEVRKNNSVVDVTRVSRKYIVIGTFHVNFKNYTIGGYLIYMHKI